MSLTKTPTTPTVAQPPRSPTVSTNATPCSWRHPRLDEITRRQRASLFTVENLRAALINASVLIATFFSAPPFLAPIFSLLSSTLDSIPPASESYSTHLLRLLRLLLLYNTLNALSPLIKRYTHKEDDMSDIALTPSQRKLLGLKETPSMPPSAGSSIATPPRYATRSASASLSGTPNTRRAVAGSTPGSGSSRKAGFAASPFANGSPNASPLLHKAVSGSGGHASGGAARRWSFGSGPQSQMGLGRSGSDSLMGVGLGESSGVFAASTVIPGTPSPAASAGKTIAAGAPSVSLNNKWLYKRDRSSYTGNGFL